MTVLRRLIAVGAAAVAAVALASPAAAIVPPADGFYTFHQDGAPDATWKMQFICIQANGTRAQSDYSDETIQTLGCTGIIASSTSDRQTREQRLVNFGGRWNLVSDKWTFQFTSDEGIQCPDGSVAPSTETYAFDGATLTGTHTTIHGPVCGGAPGMVKFPFVLSFTGGLDVPVTARFPDHCDYLAGRPSTCS
jgi:hypothetical protein